MLRLLIVIAIASPVLGSLVCSSAHGQDVPRYVVRHWTTDDGLPQNSVVDIEQTPDGYLWLATTGGLARFDGVRFTVFNKRTTPALRSNRITVLFEDQSGALWIGTENGLARYRDGTFERFTPEDGLSGTFIPRHGITQCPNGIRWFVVSGEGGSTVARFDGKRFLVLQAYTDPEWAEPLKRAEALYCDRKGRLWIVTGKPVRVLKREAGRLTLYDEEDGLPPGLIQYLGEDAEGPFEIVTRRGGRAVFQDRRFSTEDTPGARGDPITALYRDDEGRTWVGTPRGVHVTGPGQPPTTVLAPRGGSTYRITTFYEDRAGNVWVGTDRAGLFRLKEPLFRVYSTAQGLSYPAVWTVTGAPDGSLWVAAACAGLNHLVDGRFTLVTNAYFNVRTCLSVFVDRAGTLWVGTGRLIRLGEDGLEAWNLEPKAFIEAFYEDPEEGGVLWLGTSHGVFRFEAGRFTHYGLDDGLAHRSVAGLLKDRHGVLWVATRGGLSRLAPGDSTFTSYTVEDGLPASYLRALFEDPEEPGVLWIGTYGSGLLRLKDGHFVQITRADGLFDDVVSAIVMDAQGRLWMSGNRGIFRASLDTLRAFAEGERERVSSVGYGTEAGLLTAETNGGFQPAAWKGVDGRLWFPTLEGVAVVDPAEVTPHPAPPVVHVEALFQQNERVPLQSPATRLKRGQRSFEIRYTGISLDAPEKVRFRYRLTGLEEVWTGAGTRRTAFYTNVPPGTYTFEVRAANRDGVWSREAATLEIVVPPFFYETTWFLVVCLLALVLGAAGGYRRHVGHLRARHRELERAVTARTAELEEALHTVEHQAEALQELDEAKSRFFANVSHEFRTPLTLLVGPLRRLLGGAYGALPSAVHAQHGVMLRSSRRLERLINQLFDLSRLEAGSLALDTRPQDVRAHVRVTVAVFASLAETEGVTLRVETPAAPCPVRFDAGQLEKVWGNLVANALRFTPAGGAVTVRLRRTDGHAEVAVRDTGPGIAPEHLPRVFDRFYQADASPTRTHEGAGIGLALAKEVVELHGGTIRAERADGNGATFVVALPLLSLGVWEDGRVGEEDVLPTSQTPTLPYETASVGEGKNDQGTTEGLDEDRPTLLVVDDHADLRAYVRSILAPGFRVVEAEDGAEGLDTAKEVLPDLIVADVMMPVLDGLAMSRALKADPATDGIPVLLLTARAETRDEVEGLETGAEAYVTKPFDADVLLARVTGLIEQRKRLREKYRHELVLRPADVVVEASDEAFLQSIKDVIEARMADEDFDVEALVEAVAFSGPQLRRRLKALAGRTPVQLIREMRLERAAQLLEQEAGTITEIAYAVGFGSYAHFARSFKAHFGCSASDYVWQTADGTA